MTVTDLQLQNSTGKVIALGHREDDYVLESVDWGTARVNVKPIYYFPTDDSERMLHTEWEPRPVSIIGFVIGKTEADIEAKSGALENFLMMQSETDIIYNHYHLTFLPTAEVKWAITEPDNNEFWRKFHFTGVCIDPMWKNRSVFHIRAEHNDSMFMFPLIFNRDEKRVVFGRRQGISSSMQVSPTFSFPLAFNQEENKVVFGIVYGIDYIILDYTGAPTGAVITLQTIGIVSNLAINLRNGNIVQTFSLDGTYQAGTKIIIDTREGFYTITANGVDIMGNVFSGSDWFRVRTGLNIFTFNFSGTGSLDADILIKQADLFEVQT